MNDTWKTIKGKQREYSEDRLSGFSFLRVIMVRRFQSLSIVLLFVFATGMASNPTFQEGLDAYNKKDYKTAFEIFIPLAEQGNEVAQYNLGIMYSNGFGVTKDLKNGIKWLTKAAKQGNEGAQSAITIFQPMIDLFLKAEQEDANAQYDLGIKYHKGKGVAQDYKEAVRWYTKAAEQGNADAQLKLGSMYADGKGVVKDYKEAFKWYRLAAEQGNATARIILGIFYYDGDGGVVKDYEKALKWFRLAAEQGNVFAQFFLGRRYEDGKGVAQDYKEAYKWYGKAGKTDAQLKLGLVGDNRVLPFDYYATDSDSREIWFEFKNKKNGWNARVCKGLTQTKTENFTIMRSGKVLYSFDITPGLTEFLGLKVVPEKALTAYSGVNGLNFQDKLLFELEQHVRSLTIKFADKDKTIKTCTLSLSATLKTKLKKRFEYEQARAKVLGSTRKPGQIAPPLPSTTFPAQPPASQIPLIQTQQPSKNFKHIYSGTGFMFSGKDYVITNWHVVRGTKKIKVKFLNGEKINAEVLLKDPKNDIAFLKLEKSPNQPQSDLRIGDSSNMRMGDKVFTIGYPAYWVMGQNPKYTEGVVNSLSGINDDATVFQISVQIQPGNSGGPLFNQRGEVIGITQASLDPKIAAEAFGTLPQNVNYAIKSSNISSLLSKLPETLVASRGIVVVPREPENSLANFIDRAKNNIVLIEATTR